MNAEDEVGMPGGSPCHCYLAHLPHFLECRADVCPKNASVEVIDET